MLKNTRLLAKVRPKYNMNVVLITRLDVRFNKLETALSITDNFNCLQYIPFHVNVAKPTLNLLST